MVFARKKDVEARNLRIYRLERGIAMLRAAQAVKIYDATRRAAVTGFVCQKALQRNEYC